MVLGPPFGHSLIRLPGFLIPKKVPTNKKIVWFHLYSPMDYINSVTYFFTMTETEIDISKNTIFHYHNVLPYLLESEAVAWDRYNHVATMAQADAV